MIIPNYEYTKLSSNIEHFNDIESLLNSNNNALLIDCYIEVMKRYSYTNDVNIYYNVVNKKFTETFTLGECCMKTKFSAHSRYTLTIETFISSLLSSYNNYRNMLINYNLEQYKMLLITGAISYLDFGSKLELAYIVMSDPLNYSKIITEYSFNNLKTEDLFLYLIDRTNIGGTKPKIIKRIKQMLIPSNLDYISEYIEIDLNNIILEDMFLLVTFNEDINNNKFDKMFSINYFILKIIVFILIKQDKKSELNQFKVRFNRYCTLNNVTNTKINTWIENY